MKKKTPIPAPPRRAELEKVVDNGVTMPETIKELIEACGMVAVFIPTQQGIRFFVQQNFTPAQAEEFAIILEDCANTVRGMYRSPGDKLQ